MRILKFVLVLLFTSSFIFFLNHPIKKEPRNIPAIGKLLNPFSGFWNNAEPYHAESDASFNFPQLSAPVKVVYDDILVPHIFADNLSDACFVQGFIHAKYRLWQMDIATRATSGRLSEVMGPTTIKRDKMQRRKGLVFAAENTLKVWEASPEDFKNLQSYTEGVNAYINQLAESDYPIEFKLLDYKPEAWTNLKSAIFIKSMAETLCSREDDLESTNALNAFGKEIYDFLYPDLNPKQSPIIPAETEWTFDPLEIPEDSTSLLGIYQHDPFEKPAPFIGSNNWAVAGSKTKSGNPILCNDPHLRLTLPAIWYELQITTPEGSSYGVSLPGTPGIIIGFNEYISYGMTNVGHDVLDYYKIQWTNTDRSSYLLDGEQKPVRLKIETIKVKDQADIIDTVRYTEWGPVLYEDPKHPMKDLAMRWIAHDGGANELSVFRKINKAKNFEDYYDAVQGFEAPAQNIVFACTDGDIGLKVQGKFPLKRAGQGRFIRDGSSSSNGWLGFIPKDQNPQSRNPARGFVSSANQHSTAPDYPYYYHGGFEDYRGRALNDFLEKMDNITVEDMMALQGNTFSQKAADALPLLLAQSNYVPQGELEQSLLQELINWDYYFSKDSRAPILFTYWYDEFFEMTWDEIRAKRETLNAHIPYPEDWRTIALLEEDPEHVFFDMQSTHPQRETAKEIATAAFATAIKDLKTQIERDPDFNLSKYKQSSVPHLGRIDPFGSSSLNVGGDGSALNAIKGKNGPSWRMIVEMGTPVKAYGVYPGGQSGNPGSPFYDNMISHWENGRYYEKHFIKSPEALGEQTLFTETFSN